MYGWLDRYCNIIYQVGKKSSFGFFFSIRWLQQCIVVFNFIQFNLSNFVRLCCDSCHLNIHKKNLSKLVNLCVAILILKMEENMRRSCHIMLYYFKEGKNATEKQQRFVQCMEKELRLIECVKVVCKVSCWTFLAGRCSTVRQSS